MTPADPDQHLVTRCVCFDVPFTTLKDDADATGAGLYELQRRHAAGRGCGLCVPYIRRMLETGETAFTVDLGAAPREPDDG